MKQALDLGQIRVVIPPVRKGIYRCYIFKGTCFMYRIGLKAMNCTKRDCTQYPSKI